MSNDTHTDKSGPAFPTPCTSFKCDQGLTKREWFAGMAMVGLLSGTRAEHDPLVVVCASFSYADMMISVSKQGGGK